MEVREEQLPYQSCNLIGGKQRTSAHKCIQGNNQCLASAYVIVVGTYYSKIRGVSSE